MTRDNLIAAGLALAVVLSAPASANACADAFPYKTMISKSPDTYATVESFHSEANCQAAAKELSRRLSPPDCTAQYCRRSVWCVPLACDEAPVARGERELGTSAGAAIGPAAAQGAQPGLASRNNQRIGR